MNSYRILPIVVPVLLVALAGCGGDNRARVSGKVTYQDKPLPGGTVVFVTEDNGKQDRAPIQPDGTYSAANVPMGNLRVGVEPATKGAIGNMPIDAAKPVIPADSPAAKVYGQSGAAYVDIPENLRNPATSNITLKVEKSAQTFDITLKDSK
jgi:hypothetical protein